MFSFKKNKENNFSEIDNLREELDKIDVQIVETLKKRYEFTKRIGNCKEKENLGVFSPEREKEIFKNIIRANNADIPEKTLIPIFKEIISGGRATESSVKIVAKKWKTSLLKLAIKEKFGSSVNISFKDSNDEVYTAISSKPLTTYGVIPLEVNDEKASHKAISALALTNLKICSIFTIQKNDSKKSFSFAIVSGDHFEVKTKNMPTLLFVKLKDEQLLNDLISTLNNGLKIETKLISISKKDSSFIIEAGCLENSKQFISLNEKLISICQERKVIGHYSKEEYNF